MRRNKPQYAQIQCWSEFLSLEVNSFVPCHKVVIEPAHGQVIQCT